MPSPYSSAASGIRSSTSASIANRRASSSSAGGSYPPPSPSLASSALSRRNQTIADERFDRAVQIVQTLSKGGAIQPSYEEKLLLYSFYKQATEGNCRGPKPGIFDVLGRAKWDAWNKRRGLSPQDAKKGYVENFLRILRRFNDEPQTSTLISRLEAPPRSDDSEGSSDLSLTEEVIPAASPPPYSPVYQSRIPQTHRRRQSAQQQTLSTIQQQQQQPQQITPSSTSPPSTSSDEHLENPAPIEIPRPPENATPNDRALSALQVELAALNERIEQLWRAMRQMKKKPQQSTWRLLAQKVLKHFFIDAVAVLLVLVFFSRQGNPIARMLLSALESMWISKWKSWRRAIGIAPARNPET